MRLHQIDEVPLEFEQGIHICPRAGIAQYGVYDARFELRRNRILVGAVGTSDNLARLENWLDRCSNPISPPDSIKQPNLYPPFCGLNSESGFRARFVLDEEITRPLIHSEVKRIIEIEKWNERVNEAVRNVLPACEVFGPK